MSRPQPPHVIAAGASARARPAGRRRTSGTSRDRTRASRLELTPELSAREERRQRQVAHRVQARARASSTFGIELTTIDAVAMSPWMPPAIFIDSRGEPSISTESYDSGAPRYASMCSRMTGSPLPVADAVLDDAADVARIDREELARHRHRRDLRLDVVGDPIERPPERVGDHRDRFGEARRAARCRRPPSAGTARSSGRRRSSAGTAAGGCARPERG